MIDLFEACSSLYDEIDYKDFYRDIFPVGSFEERGVYVDGQYNGIAISIKEEETADKKKRSVHRHTITDDLDKLDDLAYSDLFCLMSPISYAGKSRESKNARFMYALAIDLDGVNTIKEWNFLQTQINYGHEMLCFVWGLPKPTYLVSSGTGIHIYYVFEEPVPLYRNIIRELEKLKRRLTWQAWTQGASSLHDNVQYESLFQGFRVVGTITKTGGRCKAYRVGDKITVDYLNKFVPEEYRAIFEKPLTLPKPKKSKPKLTLDEAKEKFPEWYERRIVQKVPRSKWRCKKDLYNWWIRELKGGAEQGHRYYCVMVLAIYAKKCGVPFEELEKDAIDLVPFLNSRGDKFTVAEAKKALNAYSESYMTYPIHSISERTGIPIKRNKRNGRKQAEHLMRARAVQAVDYPNGEWRNKDGRPDKKEMVQRWRAAHPVGRKADCIRETGLSKPTVLKWWN